MQHRQHCTARTQYQAWSTKIAELRRQTGLANLRVKCVTKISWQNLGFTLRPKTRRGCQIIPCKKVSWSCWQCRKSMLKELQECWISFRKVIPDLLRHMQLKSHQRQKTAQGHSTDLGEWGETRAGESTSSSPGLKNWKKSGKITWFLQVLRKFKPG